MVQLTSNHIQINSLQTTCIASLYAWLVVILGKRKTHKIKKSDLVRFLMKEKSHNFTKAKIEKYLESLRQQNLVCFDVAPKADVFIYLTQYPSIKQL
ncbi:MAG: hypothetical protein FD167_195 [bacterium]|nr:MAG: hypothetical protein FD167_195 [bacterium]